MTTTCQHSHAPSGRHPTRQLWAVLILVAVYCLAEILGGIWTGSLALLADAGHMFSDLISLLISLLAAHMATRRPSRHQTFGYYRAEILAALANGALLFVVAGGILHEAWERLKSPEFILAGPMLAVAIGGLLVNLISLKLLHQHKDENLNVRGAWLHVIGDTLGSVAVILAAVLIACFGWLWADPVASVLACLIILYSAWHLISDAMSILMEYAPRDVDVDQVRQALLNCSGVTDVHCLHVWTIASGLKAVSAHVVIQGEPAPLQRLPLLQQTLRDRFGLRHITLQLESTDQPVCCEDRTDGACLLTSSETVDHHRH